MNIILGKIIGFSPDGIVFNVFNIHNNCLIFHSTICMCLEQRTKVNNYSYQLNMIDKFR